LGDLLDVVQGMTFWSLEFHLREAALEMGRLVVSDDCYFVRLEVDFGVGLGCMLDTSAAEELLASQSRTAVGSGARMAREIAAETEELRADATTGSDVSQREYRRPFDVAAGAGDAVLAYEMCGVVVSWMGRRN
jgi:hypothetical protein